MSVDFITELNVRSIAHNLALKFPGPVYGGATEIREYACKLAELLGGDTDSLAEAGLALWSAIYVTGGPE